MEPTSSVPVESARKIEKPTTLLKATIAFYKSHWKLLALFFSIPTIASVLASLLGYGQGGLVMALSLVLVVVGFLLGVVQLPAAIHLINQLKSGLGSGFKIVGIYKVGFIFILPLIILFLIQGLSTLGGFILLIIPGVIISLYSAFSVYTLVLEGKRGFSAIEDSYSIVHGRLWVIIIRSLFIGIVAGLISIAIVGLQYIVGAMLGIDNPLGTVVQGQVLEPLFSRTLLIGIFSIVSSGIVIPLSAVYGYLLFTSAKETRSPNVDTKTFRKVVMGFMIFGIAILIAILSFAPFVVKSVLNSIKKGQIPTATSISASVFQSNILGN